MPGETLKTERWEEAREISRRDGYTGGLKGKAEGWTHSEGRQWEAAMVPSPEAAATTEVERLEFGFSLLLEVPDHQYDLLPTQHLL